MPVQAARSPDESSESERAQQLALLRLHNATYRMDGQIIKARVLELDRKKILIDTGIKIAKIAHSDITPECILGTTVPGDTPRKPGEVRVGDIVQVFLESMETPEGDMLVSGQQAAQERRFRAVWKELEERMERKLPVKGRVLNQLTGGYAVGVAGLVCFLPAAACHPFTASRIGKLQEFLITGMNKGRNNVVLRDVALSKLMREMPRQRRPHAATPPPSPAVRASPRRPGGRPQGQQHAKEIQDTAEELRSLLAGKSSGSRAGA